MRPLELRLRNFRSYFGDDFVFDFRGRRLVGIVGPIGSGKSSILDAVAFALYGKTPTIARSTKTLIHQRADNATVALRFTVNDQVWEVVRLLRRHGQSQHALYRLEADTVDPVEVEKVVLEGEVNGRVTELLGLEFDAFRRSVLLAQGRFADFLRAQPSERDKVLKGVFGHDRIDRMREVAKERGRLADTEAEKVAFQVAQLEEKAERLVTARSEMLTLEQRVGVLEKAEPELTALDERLAGSRAQRETAEQRRRTLVDLRDDLPEVAAAAALVKRVAEAESRRTAAAATVAETTRELDAAEKAEAMLDPEQLRDRIERAGVLLASIEHAESSFSTAQSRSARAVAAQATGADHRAELERRLAAAASAADAATKQLATATAEAEARQRELHAAEHGDMAAALRASLAVGDDCPVCARAVDGLPPISAAGTKLEVARASEAEARRALAAATAAASEATAEHGKVEAKLAAAAEDAARLVSEVEEAAAGVDAAEQGLAQATGELTTLLGTTDDPIEVLAAHRRRLAASAQAVADARKAVEESRRDLDEAIAAEQAVHQLVTELRVAIADVSARLAPDFDVGDVSDERLATAIETLQAQWTREHDAARTATAGADAAISALTSERADLVADLDLGDEPLAMALGSTRARAEERAAEIRRLETELEAAESLIAERDRLVAERDVMQRLAGDLTDSRFTRFLLDEERAVLGELGSDHFLRLTSGRYEFDDSGTFDIVDLTAAEAVRKSDSLSGGETFLASLALALALAEMVARTGGRLDSFFLDEGFGSLDPEHLDLAMEGIESLVAGDSARLVVVVSHVPEMRQRIEDLIVLDRSPTTGDTRVLQA